MRPTQFVTDCGREAGGRYDFEGVGAVDGLPSRKGDHARILPKVDLINKARRELWQFEGRGCCLMRCAAITAHLQAGGLH